MSLRAASLLIFWVFPAFAGLPTLSSDKKKENEIVLPSAEKAKRLGSMDIPLPAGCEEDRLRNHVRNRAYSLGGTCGALPKVWEEGTQALFRVTFQDVIGTTELPVQEDDHCQTEARLRMHQSGIDGMQKVSRIVHNEEARIRKLCQEGQQLFLQDMNSLRQRCSKHPAAGRGLDEVPGILRESQNDITEADKAKEKFDAMLKSRTGQLEQAKAKDTACDNSLDSFDAGSDGTATQTFITTHH